MRNRKSFCIKAVLFDFDGTLTKPDALDFSVIREAISCPADMPILEFIESLPTEEQRSNAFLKLQSFELRAAAKSEPNPGSEELILYLRSKKLRVGIVSRNSLQSLERALQNFKKIGISDFDLMISRDDPIKPKPSPDGVLSAARRMGIKPENILFVGDFIFDIRAGKHAGAMTVFIDNDADMSNSLSDIPKFKLEARNASISESDFTVSCLAEVRDIVRLRIPLPAGKFPNELLKGALDRFSFDDPSVLINPGIGEDIAAVTVKGEEVLVLKSDPITFATDSIGHYAVLINANDIATSGAVPRWMLTTLLFPCGTTASEVFDVMQDLKDVCAEWKITLCGGHTEITDAVTRPVVTGMLAGTVAEKHLIDKRNMKQGDKILFTKGVSVEGTSIIAREFGDRLEQLGMPLSEIETCKAFLSHISILKEAEIARRCKGTSAMHDVTEGGLATALMELSIAGNHNIQAELDSIPIFPQTREICRLFHIDPLGLIGSGSLLICCRENSCEELICSIREAGIAVTCIGEVLEHGQGIKAVKQGRPSEWPDFEVDEITRLF